MKTSAALLLLLALLSPPLSLAQSPPSPNQKKQTKPPQTEKAPQPTPREDDDVVRVDLNLVQVDAVVTDKKGHLVTDLKAEDFSISENGRTREVEYCNYVPLSTGNKSPDRNATRPPSATELGRTFVFVVDNPTIEVAYTNATPTGVASGNFTLLTRTLRAGVEAEKLLNWFVDTELGPNDLAALADTEVDIGVLTSFTNDRAALRQAIRKIRENAGKGPVVRVTSVNRQGSLAELAHQNLRVLETVSNVIRQLQTLPGRKVITLLSRGMIFQPQLPDADIVIERMKKLIDQANEARVSIYAVSPAGVGNFGGSLLQNFDSLIHLSKKTGGRTIYNTNDSRIKFAQIAEQSRGYYMLAYKGDPETHSRPHSIKVQLQRSDLVLDARETVYSPARTVPETESAETSLRAATNSPLTVTAIPVEISASYALQNGQPAFLTTIKVGLVESDLITTDDTIKVDFDLALSVTGPEGNLMRWSTHKLALTGSPAEKERALREGLSARFEIPAIARGFYRINVAVRNSQSGELGSTSSLVKAGERATN